MCKIISKFSNILHVLDGKFRCFKFSVFLGAVGHVVGLTANEKMERIDACWIVTFMENIFSFWNVSEMHFKGIAVSAPECWRVKLPYPSGHFGPVQFQHASLFDA